MCKLVAINHTTFRITICRTSPYFLQLHEKLQLLPTLIQNTKRGFRQLPNTYFHSAMPITSSISSTPARFRTFDGRSMRNLCSHWETVTTRLPAITGHHWGLNWRSHFLNWSWAYTCDFFSWCNQRIPKVGKWMEDQKTAAAFASYNTLDGNTNLRAQLTLTWDSVIVIAYHYCACDLRPNDLRQEGWRLTVQMIKRREHQQFQPEEERRRERCHEIDWCDTWYIIPNGVLVSHKLRGTSSSQILWTGSAALKDCPAGVIEAGTNRNDTMIPVMLAFEVSVNVVWNQRINDINDQIT